MGVFAALAAGSTDDGSPEPDEPQTAVSAAGTPARTNTHFAHGTMNVRRGPGQNFPVKGSVSRGDTLSLGEPDANGWARILGPDSGYVFTRLGLIRTEPPAEVPAYAEGGECAEAMRVVHARMNRAPDEIKRFEQAELREVTWWYRERPRDRHPRYQFSFLQGPYTDGCRTSEIET